METSRRLFIGLAGMAGAGLIIPSTANAAKSVLVPSTLPIGTIIPTMDSTYGGFARYKILCDGDYWLPLWIPNYFLQVRRFPVLFGLIGYSYGRRDTHSHLYGADGEFALPYYDPNFESLTKKARDGYVSGVTTKSTSTPSESQ